MERYKGGESLESMLPDAFAAIIEADERVLGMRPYDVQIMSGVALHYGVMAEMNTGEGKTLSATMPLYLNALTGRTCILVTTNDYLASRDGKEMGEVYNFMGLTCTYPNPNEKKEEKDDKNKKKKFYSANIVYCANAQLGFDYLFNNLVKRSEDRFITDMYYAIVDEADAVLLDSAIMPLVIAGAPRVQSNLYDVADFFVRTLVEDQDYIEEDEAVWITPEGINHAEKFFGIDHYCSKENFEINRHVILSLRAHKLMTKNKEYVVSDKKTVELFDRATGRLMEGMSLRGGQHQAIEAKEKVKLTQEHRTVASITFQNLFLLFEKFAGMSGTVRDAKDELLDVYGKKVVRIPTNRPLIRKDLKDCFFRNSEEQFEAAAQRVIDIHKTSQPVLVVLNSVTDTDIFSKIMLKYNIPHTVLNASNAFWEAEIIKLAGQKDAVTVSTPMAGRGTDIKLGKGVKELGGLAVIGVGRMQNTRNERQARGRSGRQGDPGFSQFYISLDDDIVHAEDNEKLQKYIEGKRWISKHRVKSIVNGAQKNGDDSSTQSRKESVQYDQVLLRQRKFIYETRNNLLDGENIPENTIIEVAKENIADFLDANKELTKQDLNRYILDNISYSLDDGLNKIPISDRIAIENYLLRRVKKGMASKKHMLNNTAMYDQFVREATLAAVDDGWIDLIDYLEQLKYAVTGRKSAQRNVLFEYQNEAYESYCDTEKNVKKNMMRNILLSEVSIDKKGELSVVYP